MTDKTEFEPAGQQVIVQRPRLPWHDAIEERYGDIGVNSGTWKALVEARFPLAASIDSVLMVLSYCKARRLDPFKGVVHIVPIWSKEKGAMVDTVWPGIGELRTTAFRTKQFIGVDPAEFGPDVDHAFSNDKTVTFPEWCSVTVHRQLGDTKFTVTGPRVYWMETYAQERKPVDNGPPNYMWAKRPRGQLEKCAEAAALRRAFPEEVGNEHTNDEMQGTVIDDMRDVTPRAEAGDGARRLAARAEEQLTADPGWTAEDTAREEEGAADDTYYLVNGDGEEIECVDASAFGNQFVNLVTAETSIGNVDGLWDSNEKMLGRLREDDDGLFDIVEENFDRHRDVLVAEEAARDAAEQAEAKPAEPDQAKKTEPAKPKRSRAAAAKAADGEKDPATVPLIDNEGKELVRHTRAAGWYNGLYNLVGQTADTNGIIRQNQAGHEAWVKDGFPNANSEWTEISDYAATRAARIEAHKRDNEPGFGV